MEESHTAEQRQELANAESVANGAANGADSATQATTSANATDDTANKRAANEQATSTTTITSTTENGDRPLRLPSALEHIRALADGGGVNAIGGDEANGAAIAAAAAAVDATATAAASAPASAAPTRRSSAKPKKYRCKQCGHVSTTKDDQWRHSVSFGLQKATNFSLQQQKL